MTASNHFYRCHVSILWIVCIRHSARSLAVSIIDERRPDTNDTFTDLALAFCCCRHHTYQASRTTPSCYLYVYQFSSTIYNCLYVDYFSPINLFMWRGLPILVSLFKVVFKSTISELINVSLFLPTVFSPLIFSSLCLPNHLFIFLWLQVKRHTTFVSLHTIHHVNNRVQECQWNK